MSLCRALMCPEQCHWGLTMTQCHSLMSQCHKGLVLTWNLLPFLCLGTAEREKQDPEGLEEPAGGVLKSRKS